MKTLHFSIKINAPPEKVWNTMLDDNTYRQWTKEFMEGSYFEGSWQKGSKILFLAPNDKRSVDGIVSTILENRPYEFISIKHLGIVENGVEDTSSDKIKSWAGALENYTFKSANGGTELLVDMDSDEKEVEMFNKIWPKALQKLKELAEK